MLFKTEYLDAPVIMVYGNSDSTVIYEENGMVLEKYYKENGVAICVIEKSMCSHHPHGVKKPDILVNFIEQNYMESDIESIC